MLFGPTDLSGFKVEIMLKISFLLVGDKRKLICHVFRKMYMYTIYISLSLFSYRSKVVIENVCNFNWIYNS